MEITSDVHDLFISNRQYFPTAIQEFQFFDKYSRWLPDKGRREVWEETVDRAIGFLHRNCKVQYTGDEWNSLRRATLEMRAMPSMRVLQMAGPALERCNVGTFNCAYTTLDNLDAFPELLYILMQGSGVGYSVEDQYVSRLPRVKKQRRVPAGKYVIPDTTEGWCDALKLGLHCWFNGTDVEFDYSQVRPCGAILRIKGGRASGPQPLMDLLTFVRTTVLNRQGRHLTTLDAHDIACYCGFIVQVGGVRRSSEISLSDFEDNDIKECKNGEFWKRFPYRQMSNNSAVYEDKPDAVSFMEEWLNLAKSGTGERGIFNREASIPKRRKRVPFGMNPCGEIILRPRQFCNLSIAVARDDDDLNSMREKVRLATMYGTAQATLTKFPYLSSKWKENCEEEMLLGVDITGQRDCYLFNSNGSNYVYMDLKQEVRNTNVQLAERFGLPVSAATTCGKPSGNSGQFLNCANGVHVRCAPYYIRRARTGAYTPVGKMLKDAGVPCFPETGQDAANPTVLVFEFPVKSPEGAICQQDVNAAAQFRFWLDAKTNYAEHSISCTIYVKDDEWLTLGALVYENWDKVSGLSFFPKDSHLYPLAPYEPISKEEFERRMLEFPDIDWAKLTEYEKQDETTVARDYACVSGACEL